MGTEKARLSRGLVGPVLACRFERQANPVFIKAEVRSGSNTTVYREVTDARLPGKATKL